MHDFLHATSASYDRVAAEYTTRIAHELADKPLDRALLDCFAEQVGTAAPVCDLGCGPGHVAHYLQQRGLDVWGIDLAPALLDEARRLHPGIHFQTGNMLALDIPAATFGGIVAFYSIIHIPRAQVVAALTEMRRVLQPGGRLLLAFHMGPDTVHLDEFWGIPVSLDFAFFQTDEMLTWLEAAGFVLEAVTTRAPYPDVEHQSQRAYISAVA